MYNLDDPRYWNELPMQLILALGMVIIGLSQARYVRKHREHMFTTYDRWIGHITAGLGVGIAVWAPALQHVAQWFIDGTADQSDVKYFRGTFFAALMLGCLIVFAGVWSNDRGRSGASIA